MSLQKGLWPALLCKQCVHNGLWVNSTRGIHSTSKRNDIESTTIGGSSQSAPPIPTVSAEHTATKKRDPTRVNTPVEERRLLRQQGLMPIGSRRRRAALATTGNIPFAQLPYQCFQEARKFLQQDRDEKLENIRVQRERLEKCIVATVAPQDEARRERRVADMRTNLEQLKRLADSNDPLIKKKFEDGMGDMSKPIYRYLADKKWRSYKRLLLMQRITQMHVVPDVFPRIDPTVSTILSFGRHKIEHGAFVDSSVSEHAPTLDIQCYSRGSKLVTIVVVTPDMPDVEKDSFEYRCHFLASNIEISPTETRVDLGKLDLTTQVILPWLPAYAQKGLPYHRMSIFVLQQSPQKKSLDTPMHKVDVAAIKEAGRYTERDGFILRSFVDKYQLNPIGVDLFRTKWDDSTAGVMQRANIAGWNVEFKPKRVEPLPYKRKDSDRYR